METFKRSCLLGLVIMTLTSCATVRAKDDIKTKDTGLSYTVLNYPYQMMFGRINFDDKNIIVKKVTLRQREGGGTKPEIEGQILSSGAVAFLDVPPGDYFFGSLQINYLGGDRTIDLSRISLSYFRIGKPEKKFIVFALGQINGSVGSGTENGKIDFVFTDDSSVSLKGILAEFLKADVRPDLNLIFETVRDGAIN